MLCLLTVMCVPFCSYVHVVSVQDGREHRVPLKLKWQVIVSCILWVLGVKPGTFVKAAKSFNWAVSPTQSLLLPAAPTLSAERLLSTTVDSSGLGHVFEVWWRRSLCLHGPLPESDFTFLSAMHFSKTEAKKHRSRISRIAQKGWKSRLLSEFQAHSDNPHAGVSTVVQDPELPLPERIHLPGVCRLQLIWCVGKNSPGFSTDPDKSLSQSLSTVSYTYLQLNCSLPGSPR